MVIDVGHRPLKLHNRVRLTLRNPRLACERLEAFTDAKLDKGYRLRVFHEADWLEVSANSHEMLRMALRCLKDAGYIKSIYGHTWSIIPENKRLNY